MFRPCPVHTHTVQAQPCRPHGDGGTGINEFCRLQVFFAAAGCVERRVRANDRQKKGSNVPRHSTPGYLSTRSGQPCSTPACAFAHCRAECRVGKADGVPTPGQHPVCSQFGPNGCIDPRHWSRFSSCSPSTLPLQASTIPPSTSTARAATRPAAVTHIIAAWLALPRLLPALAPPTRKPRSTLAGRLRGPMRGPSATSAASTSPSRGVPAPWTQPPPCATSTVSTSS